MPAAAVIPAPIAYIKVVAVKKLVVGFLVGATGRALIWVHWSRFRPSFRGKVRSGIKLSWYGILIVYCEKIRVFKAGLRLEYISME